MKSKPARPRPVSPDPQVASSQAEDGLVAVARAGEAEMTRATFGYLGAIFLGPVIPLAVYLLRSRRSPFMRYHAATALNLSLTAALYGLCCLILGGLLLLDSVTAALIVAIPVGLVIWVSALRYLIRGAIAANRGERSDAPNWICAHIVG